MTGALLITAALGAMVLAHRERHPAADAARVVRSSASAAASPSAAAARAPGVYARHNAVDTPALLPDGTPR